MAADDLLDALRADLGAGAVLDGDDMAGHLVGPRAVWHGQALAVVRPADTNEVAAVVRRCADAGVAVVSQGGNTGMSGGAIPDPSRPAVILHVGRLAAIESIDPDRWTMTVQAGATIQAMHEAAATHGRLFAPDWGARGTATIGGAIATDAGGNNVVRYGNMREQILGLEVVLPDGRVWDGLRSLRKDSSGYDLKQLFIGSEGTLGVVTRAVVKLHPATPFTSSALATLADLDRLMELFALARRESPDIITAFELIPELGLDRVCEVFDIPRPIATRAEFSVLIKVASTEPATDELAALLETALAAGLITDGVVAATRDQEERLWTIRDELTPARLWPDTQAQAVKLDTAVPIDQSAAFLRAVAAIAAEVTPDAVTYGFGHVGDGNIHMRVLPLAAEDLPDFLARRDTLQARIDELTFSMRGTLSAEHGIGRELRHRIAGQKSDIEWELMRRVKNAFDPAGLMNPGVMLPD